MNRILLLLIAVAALAAAAFLISGDNDTPEDAEKPVATAGPAESAAGKSRAPESVTPPSEGPAVPKSGKPAADTAEKAQATAPDTGKSATAPTEAPASASKQSAGSDSKPVAGTTRSDADARKDADETAGSESVTTSSAVPDSDAVREKLERKAEQKLNGAKDEAVAAVTTVPTKPLQPVAPKREPETNTDGVPVIPRRAVAPPGFDVVRISDVDCTAVMAGRAPSRAIVRIAANGKTIATLRAESDGSWAHVVSEPFTPGGVELTLTAETTAGMAESPESVVLVVPDCADLSGDNKAIALLTPKNRTGTRILQEPDRADRIAMPEGLNLGKVDYDDKGNLEMSGNGAPDAELRAYVDGAFAGRARVDAQGQWRIMPETEIAPGLHVLRVDHVDSSGVVLARIELPFARVAPASVEVTTDQVIVQPGNSLWRIARRTYGRGISFTTIYEANRDRIRDPDLIYPGQVFELPDLPDTINN